MLIVKRQIEEGGCIHAACRLGMFEECVAITVGIKLKERYSSDGLGPARFGRARYVGSFSGIAANDQLPRTIIEFDYKEDELAAAEQVLDEALSELRVLEWDEDWLRKHDLFVFCRNQELCDNVPQLAVSDDSLLRDLRLFRKVWALSIGFEQAKTILGAAGAPDEQAFGELVFEARKRCR